MRKRTDFTVTLNHGGPTVTERQLKCFLKLEEDGITIAITDNGVDLILSPADKAAKLPYFSRLARHKEALLALTRYVIDREHQQGQSSKELTSNGIEWGNKAS